MAGANLEGAYGMEALRGSLQDLLARRMTRDAFFQQQHETGVREATMRSRERDEWNVKIAKLRAEAQKAEGEAFDPIRKANAAPGERDEKIRQFDTTEKRHSAKDAAAVDFGDRKLQADIEAGMEGRAEGARHNRQMEGIGWTNAKNYGRGGSGGMTPNQQFSAINSLNRSYNANTKAAREIQRQHQVMSESWSAYAKGGASKGVAEQGVIATFNKILDPDSVVREGEYDRTDQGQALLDRMDAVARRVGEGGVVAPKVLQEMVTLAGTYAKHADTFAKGERRRTERIADRMGIEHDLIFADDEPPPDATPGANGAPAPRKSKFSVVEVK